MTGGTISNALRAVPLRITLILVGCGALVIANGASLWLNLRAIEDAIAEINRSWAVVDNLSSMQSKIALTESGHRGYLLTGDEAYLDGIGEARARLQANLAALAVLVADVPHQAERLARIRAVDARLQELQSAAPPDRTRGTGEAARIGLTARSDAGKQLLDEATALRTAMEGTARSTLRAKNALSLERSRMAATVGLVISGVTLLTLLIFYLYIVRNVVRRQQAEALLRAANETLEAKVASRTAQLSHLSGHLLELAEAEKATLANELHDELGSNLTAINLDVSSVATRLAAHQPALAERLHRALRVLRDTVQLKRRIIQGLRPTMLETMGLSAAVQMHCEDFSRRTGLPCTVDCPEDLPDLDPALAIALYRVVQEALTNISKYAHASHAHVSISTASGGVRLQVVDDGIGVDSGITDKPLAYGVLGMRERIGQLGGSLVVGRRDDAPGTLVEARVPLTARARRRIAS